MPCSAPSLHRLDDLRHQREELHPLRDPALPPVLLDPAGRVVPPILPLHRSRIPPALCHSRAKLPSPVRLHERRSIVQPLSTHVDSLLGALELLTTVLFPPASMGMFDRRAARE